MYLFKKHPKKIIVGAVVLVVAIVFYIFFASTCIVRTGVMPDPVYFTDNEAFAALIDDMEERALQSLLNQFNTVTGFFNYLVHPDGAVNTELNNDIRQLLGARVLATKTHNNEHIAALHRSNLETIFEQWYQEEGGNGFVYFDDKSKLGANAMFLRVLVASPHFDEFRDEADALVRGIVSLVDEEGSFVPFYRVPVGYVYDADYLLTFYSGEAILALLEYVDRTGDQGVLQQAKRVQDFYIDRYVAHIGEHYYPAYVPWHTRSLAVLYQRTEDERYRDAIFILNDKLLELQDTTQFVGRFYNPDTPEYGSPHAASDAIYTEGLAAAYGTALISGDEKHIETYRRALTLALFNLQELQYVPTWWDIFRYGEKAESLRGGVTTNACSSWVRVDNTAHTLDALEVIQKVLAR